MSEYIQLDLFEDLPVSSGEARPRRKRRKRLADETLDEKIERALRLLRSAASGSDQPIEVSYSGGKDSDVILELVRMAGIPYRAIYKNTTIDPPGTIKHCLDKGVEVVRRATFADVIREKGFPTWRRRFCCDVLKEYKILDRSVQGIRRSESTKRARRYKEPTVCRLYGQDEHVEVFLPILHWTDKDVASFIQRRGIQCHPLYYDGGGGSFTPNVGLAVWAVPSDTTVDCRNSRSTPVWSGFGCATARYGGIPTTSGVCARNTTRPMRCLSATSSFTPIKSFAKRQTDCLAR